MSIKYKTSLELDVKEEGLNFRNWHFLSPFSRVSQETVSDRGNLSIFYQKLHNQFKENNHIKNGWVIKILYTIQIRRF